MKNSAVSTTKLAECGTFHIRMLDRGGSKLRNESSEDAYNMVRSMTSRMFWTAHLWASSAVSFFNNETGVLKHDFNFWSPFHAFIGWIMEILLSEWIQQLGMGYECLDYQAGKNEWMCPIIRVIWKRGFHWITCQNFIQNTLNSV